MPERRHGGAYSWKEGNVNIRSAEIRNPISEAARVVSNPWEGVRKHEGIKIWRIHKYRAVHWPIEEYGHFYHSDVFIVLKSPRHADDDVKSYTNIHLWVGKRAKHKDYSVGVYKVAELAERLGFAALVHREVQGLESDVFKNYFDPLVYWKGSSDDNYRNTIMYGNSRMYRARMLQSFKPDVNKSNVVAKEVPCNARELDPNFTYILDAGKSVFIWQSNLSDNEEDQKGLKFVENYFGANRGCTTKIELLNEDVVEGHKFWDYLSRDSYLRDDDSEEDDMSTLSRSSTLHKPVKRRTTVGPCLLRIDLVEDVAEYTFVKDGVPSYGDLEQCGECIYHSEGHCFVWFSGKTPIEETGMGLQYAHDYLKKTNCPLIPVTVLREGQRNVIFDRALNAKNRRPVTSYNQVTSQSNGVIHKKRKDWKSFVES